MRGGVKAAILCGIAGGALLVLSLPKPDLYPFAWIALAPLLFAIARDNNLLTVVYSSYAAGLIFFAGTFYWITETMTIFGGLSLALAIAIGALFTVVYALYFVLFALGLHLAIRRFGTRGLFFAAPLWVTVELLRAHLFSGFPWMLSGYALVPYAGILQIVTWTGIYGLSFVATAVNSLIAYGAIHRSKAWLGVTALVIAILWFLPILGETPSGAALEVRLVQTNISLDQPWKKPASDNFLNELGALSTREGSRPRLVVWPETPAPFYLNEDQDFRSRMRQIAQKLGAYFLVGYIDAIGEGPTNSAALLDQHRISTAICYESIFPALVRQFVRRGSELIVVITNDGWFGESSAPFQHLRMGIVRSVENRRYMVRAANTGITAIIDPYGRIIGRTPIGVRTILDGTVRYRSDRTFYTQYGDVFAYANALVAVAAVS